MSTYHFDVLVLGCGVAGLSSAIKLAEDGFKVGIVTRATDPQIANTNYAQGGIIFPFDERGPGNLVEDIDKASGGTSNLEAAEILSRRGGDFIKEILLDKAHADFNKNDHGDLLFTKEGAHSKARIIYKGDYTGKEIQRTLLCYLRDEKRFPNVTFMAGHTAVDLLTPAHHGIRIQQRYEEEKVVGAYLYSQSTGEISKALAKVTILATGGLGALYLHHTNAEGARGDGHAMAKRAGATLTNLEFIQFHPTTLYDRSGHGRFLISEAVRGEGGILINAQGEAFMGRYHPQKDLAPRDIVARAIVEEMVASHHDCVYLDVSHKIKTEGNDWFANRFPTIFKRCAEAGININTAPIPVVPAAHYACGGVKTNLKGETTLRNLYAVGEVACTGLHGANRLASTALLEGLTFGAIAAEDIKQKLSSIELYPSKGIRHWETPQGMASDMELVEQDWLTLKQTMWNYVGIVRTSQRLKRASAMFYELSDEIQRFYRNNQLSDKLIGLRNAVEVGQLVLQASMRNRRSAGCFYRKD